VVDNLPEPEEPARGSLGSISTSQWRQRMTTLFADDAGPATQLIQATTHDLTASAVHTMPSLPTWHTERVIVIGDAAHAPSPTSGQGASLAIEDAVQLAKCLRDLSGPGQAFGTFEQLRRPRTEKIIKQAARVNNNKAATGITRVFRDLMMPVMMPLFVKLIANGKPGRQLYGHHIDWDTPIAPAPRNP
jgi:2-polyprenyl-6-methoxyphenol hydroxylase-like FAD-dependent oxidoreductase